MRSCKICKQRVHTTCALHVAFRVEVVCKTCTPRPQVVSQPPTKCRCHFTAQGRVGRPWLQYANGAMWCIACKEYPQLGVQQLWLTGTTQLRKQTMVEHSNCNVHYKSLALWESGGASTTIIGTLPAPIRNAIAGLCAPGHTSNHPEAIKIE